MKFLLKLLPEHIREELEGDLEQQFQKNIKKFGVRRARLKDFWNTVFLLRPGILFRKSPIKKHYPPFMFKNYIVIAIRNVMAHKTNSAINMLSLIVGITSALIMISVIRYELSFDQFHSNAGRIYRIYRENESGFGSRGPGIGYPVADVFREEVSSIEKITGVQYYGGAQVDVEINDEWKKFRETEGMALVDNEFFNVFDFSRADFKWLAGNSKNALMEPFTAVLTESAAKKYFGTLDPINKSIRIEGQVDVKITGVVKDFPINSDLPFSILVSYSTLYELEGKATMRDDWNSINANHQAFVLLPENTSPAQVEQQFDKVHAAHVKKDLADERKYRLQPLSEMHKDGKLNNFNSRTADETMLWIIGLTGLLLLTVGCINYINIATAQTTLRGREIGVRKVLGGQKQQLVLQFLSETFILVAGACVISIFLAEVLLVNMSSLTSVNLLQHLFTDPFILLSLGVLIVAITLMAGFYPAVVVSAYGIITSLKGQIGGNAGSGYLRKTLVVTQFAVTQVFLIGAFIVINQLQYSRKMDLGFDKDLILNVAIPQNSTAKNQQLRDMINNIPSVSALSISSSFPSGRSRNHWFVGIRKKEAPIEDNILTEYQAVDPAFIDLYGIGMSAGKNFVSSDSVNSAIINEVVAETMGFREHEDAIGTIVDVDGKEYQVVGVMKNFHNNSMRDEIGSMVFVYKPSFFFTTSMKLKADPSNLQDVIVDIEKIWATVYPTMLFDYDFFDENIESYYREDQKLSRLLQIFSGVFLVVACLGLYGLISFVINRRMKEVAVRKVFGASVMNIMNLISKDYIVLVVISFAVAVPISYYFMDQWLEGYKYHVPITWWILIVPGAVALGIAMITLSGKLIKAASRNPADTLKYE